jgi:hypothetical protein
MGSRTSGQAKRTLSRYSGIPKAHFHLFLKETEFRVDDCRCHSSRPRLFLLVNGARRPSAHTSKINDLHVILLGQKLPKSGFTGRM